MKCNPGINAKYICFGLIILYAIIITGCSSKPVADGKYDALAKCLTADNVVMYGTSWCTHCQNQKAAFGSSFQYVTFVDCDADTAACTAAGVQGYPTWVINGTSYPGEQNLYTLAKDAGCISALESGNTTT
jgi:glutaredoxin